MSSAPFIIREKCRAGIMLENARAIIIEFFANEDPAAIRDATSFLDRFAGEIRAEVAAELGESYERVWNECEDLDFFAPIEEIDIPIGWEFSAALVNGRTWRRPIDVAIWSDPQISQFLKDAAMHLGLDYERNAFVPRTDQAIGDHDAARILDYFAWLHFWIQDADTLAAPLVFKVLQSELERLAGEDCSENDEEIPT